MVSKELDENWNRQKPFRVRLASDFVMPDLELYLQHYRRLQTTYVPGGVSQLATLVTNFPTEQTAEELLATYAFLAEYARSSQTKPSRWERLRNAIAPVQCALEIYNPRYGYPDVNLSVSTPLHRAIHEIDFSYLPAESLQTYIRDVSPQWAGIKVDWVHDTKFVRRQIIVHTDKKTAPMPVSLITVM